MYGETEYFHSDLFRALNDKRNQLPGYREHPVFAALLYAFCPTAVKWWQNGAEPSIPYDVAWDAASDFASGITLKEAIQTREVPDLLGHVKKYIKVVEACRKSPASNYRASELSPAFGGEEIEVTARTGYQAAFDKHFGGDWRNLLRYVRVWAFLIPDWRGDAAIQPGKGEYAFERVSVAFSVPRLTWRTLEWPGWAWRVKNGRALRIVLGMMVNDNAQDELRFALAAGSPGYFADTEEDGRIKRRVVPWEATPHVYSLDRRVGWARPMNAHFDVEKLVAHIPDLSAAASKGAAPPMGALTNYRKCERCGFHALCFTQSKEVSSIVYEGLKSDAAKFDRSIM